MVLYLLHLCFLVNFLQTDTQQEKEVTWPRAPPFSVIVAGNSQCFPNIYSCCSLSFPSCLTWPSAPMDVHNQRCRKLLFSDMFMEYVLPLVFPRGNASWVTCNFCCWTWDESIAIQCRRQGRKGLLGLCFQTWLFCSLS